MNSVVEITNVGKAYRNFGGEWRRVLSWFWPSLRPQSERWVLRGISFAIRPGEAIGLVGKNGAGKSTLLKIIVGTLSASEGKVSVRGCIAAILELGMGFHPDLTGRQNAYHAAGLMGYSHEEIDSVIDEIRNFSEIGDYFDQPVRIYSSGMQMRVAFAVVTAHRPEILIVDEALSVGDTYFQHKSFDRIRRFQEQGTTLLVVSHDSAAIQAICNRAILLDNGGILMDGDPETVMDYYNALIASKEESKVEQIAFENGKVQTISGTGEAKIEEVGLYNVKGEKAETVGVGDMVSLRVRVRVVTPIESLVLGYGIKDRLGQFMFGTNTWHTGQIINCPEAGDVYGFSIEFPVHFGVGSYSIPIALHDKDTHLTANYEWRDYAVIFTVINVDKIHFAGCCWNQPVISVEKQ